MALRFGEDGTGDSAIMARPFGVALLIAGVDAKAGPQLFFADPSGTFMQYAAKAMGSASDEAQSQLQEEYRRDLGLEEAEMMAIKLLKKVMEDKMDATNAQVAIVTREGGFHVYSEAELAERLAKL